jgi:L-malate glycosyltransferase
MRIVFICQAVDEDDPILATTVSWLRTLACKSHIESLFVITLRKGTFNLPENVEVHAIGGGNRLGRIWRFYAKVSQALQTRPDCFFVYQAGPYPALLLPFKLLAGKHIFQWQAHPYVNLVTGFNVRFCTTAVFTSTANALPIDSPKVRVIGQGVDTARFHAEPIGKDRQLVTVGRVSPVKRLDRMIRVLALLNRDYGRSFTLDIYGPTAQRDRDHLRALEMLVAELGVSDYIFFRGAVPHAQLPRILNRYQLFLNYSETALDRAVVEAMACGLTVLFTNPCVAEILPTELKSSLMIPRDDITAQAERIQQFLSMHEDERTSIGSLLRDIVLRDHSVDAILDKIVQEMESEIRQMA